MPSVDVLEAIRAVDDTVVTQDGLGLKYISAGRTREDGIRLWVTTPFGFAYQYVVPRALDDAAADLRPDALSMVQPRDRVEALAEAADVVDDLSDQIARLISAETGKERAAAADEVEAAAHVLRASDRLVDGRPSAGRGMLLAPSSPRSWTAITVSSARGVALVLPPFTAPFFGAIAGIATSLAAGVPVVVRAPWQAAASAIAAALVVRKTDLGDYVTAAPSRGAPQVSGLAGVILFGRKETSSAVLRELGVRPSSNCTGRSALVVCSEPSDVESLAKSVAGLAVSHAGQACGSVRWVLARRGMAGPLVDSLADAMEQLSVGNPLEGKDVGPLRARGLVERAHRLINDAVAKGAQAVIEFKSTGNYASPALIRGVPRGADLMWTDLQAPVVAVTELEDCSEAVATASMMVGASHVLFYGPLATAASLASSRPGLIVIRLREDTAAPSTGPCYSVGDPVESLSGGAEPWGRSLLLF